MLSRTLPILVAVVVLAGSARAQLAPPTTVQLPTFNFTTVNTTVNVPDGGSALLGGIKRASSGSVERGVPVLGKVPYVNRLFKNRAIGQSRTHSMMHTKAKILILEELEEEVMGQAAQSRAARGDRRTFEQLLAEHQAAQHAEFLRRNLARPPIPLALQQPPPQTVPDVDQIRRENEEAREQRLTEAASYFEKGQSAQAAGKIGVARIYYQMAARRATGTLKVQIQAQLDGLVNH